VVVPPTAQKVLKPKARVNRTIIGGNRLISLLICI
jgi:hypothetical protein